MKRILSLVLAVAMVLGLSITASAAGKINGIIKPINTNSDPDFSVVTPGQILKYPLTADMFSWSDGSTGSSSTPVTKSQIDAGKVNVRYSGSETGLIEKISIEYEGGSRNAYVKVEFADELVSVNSKDFKLNLYLAINNSRSSDSLLALNGTMENEEVRVSTSTDYVRSSGGRVIVPDGHISNLEFECGNGVFIKTRVYGDRKYYANTSAKITSEDDAILNKYSDIEEIITLKTVNINSGKIVYFEDHKGYHVYDAKYNYLGVAPAAMDLSTKYYLSRTKIDMGGAGNAGGSSSSSSASSSSASSTTSSSSTVSNSGVAGEVITVDKAKSLTTAAINTAKSSGSKTASVRVKDASSISAAALQAMNQTATASGMTSKLNADTMNGTAVSGRLGINPALAANLTGDIQLGVYLNNTTAASTKEKFEKWFSNKVVAVSLAQKGSFGMSVEVVVKADLSSLNTNSLVFYSYNASANQYSQISNPNYTIDANGFLHFYTSSAGEIIITDKTLTRR